MSGSGRRVLVAGCGGLGSVYAAHLAQAAQVVAFDADAARVEAMRRRGLRITGCSEIRVEIEAISDAAQLSAQAFDAVLVMVKSMHTASLMSTLAARLRGRPLLVTMQNGQGNVEILAAACEWDILHGMTWEAGEPTENGGARHTVHGPPACLYPARGNLADTRWLGELLDRCGLPTRVVEDGRGAVWSKFIFNCAMNPVSALLRGIPQAKYLNDDVHGLLRMMVEEGVAVARAQGIEPDKDPLQLVEDVRAGRVSMPRHPGSMAMDLAAGRATEIEALTGHLLSKARELGVAAPIHEMVYRLLKGLEYGLRVRADAGHNRATNPTKETG